MITTRRKIRAEIERLRAKADEVGNDVEAQLTWASQVKRLLDVYLGPGPQNIHSEAFYEFDHAKTHNEKVAILDAILISQPLAAESRGATKETSPPLTVFVCSTYADLSKEREAVLNAIRRLQLQHDSMEFFGARTGQPIETCLEEVRRSNILVVIVGHRYGTLVPDLGVSFSEAEYQEGYRTKKPCLVYIRGDDVPILPRNMERDPDKLKLLEVWKATLQERHTIASFEQGSDLAVQVAADLGRTISELREAGRAREEARTESPVNLVDEVTNLISATISEGVPEPSLLSAIRRSISAAISETKHLSATVFLSYASPDREIVRRVAAGLKEEGIRVWFDEASLKPGSKWMQEIERGLDAADFIMFFISPRSVQKGWAQQELQIALHRQVSGEEGAIILPVLLERAEVPPLLRNIQWLDMTDGDVKKAVRSLAEVIRHHMNRRRADGGPAAIA